MKSNAVGNNVPWTKIKWLRFAKEKPGKIFYKLQMSGEFFEVDTKARRTNTTSGLSAAMTDPLDLLRSPYSSPLPISKAKYEDLATLCRMDVILKAYHTFYADLPYNATCAEDA